MGFVDRDHLGISSMDLSGSKTARQHWKRIPWEDLTRAAISGDFARELTHPLYRYPGSMSPQLARALILGLTRPGDTVLDPFCGGGTTAIEALAHNRKAICGDLNTLASFITRAKAWPLSHRSLRNFHKWVEYTGKLLLQPTIFRPVPLVLDSASRYAPKTHGLLLILRSTALGVRDTAAQRFALLTVLRVGQLCFDCRNGPPSPKILIRAFQVVSSQALAKMRSYTAICRNQPNSNTVRSRLKVFKSNAVDLSNKLGSEAPEISLVLTSPPYPGVHILYHRWQVFGRRETALPYSLLGTQDGRYESHYTLGPRQEPENQTYFEKLKTVFTRLRSVLGPKSIVAQVVAFSNPKQHLVSFRKVMCDAGYYEITNPGDSSSVVTRIVPRRRWYATISPRQESGQEYLFIHRPQ